MRTGPSNRWRWGDHCLIVTASLATATNISFTGFVYAYARPSYGSFFWWDVIATKLRVHSKYERVVQSRFPNHHAIHGGVVDASNDVWRVLIHIHTICDRFNTSKGSLNSDMMNTNQDIPVCYQRNVDFGSNLSNNVPVRKSSSFLLFSSPVHRENFTASFQQ